MTGVFQLAARIARLTMRLPTDFFRMVRAHRICIGACTRTRCVPCMGTPQHRPLAVSRLRICHRVRATDNPFRLSRIQLQSRLHRREYCHCQYTLESGNDTPAKLLRELGFDAVTHGFRSSFRDYAAEKTHTPHAVMEAALAHTIKNKAEAAYARSDLFEKRRELMESWGQYLAG